MSKELTPLEAVKCLKEQFEICGIKNNPYLKIIETALKDYEMEYTLRVRLENINYKLVREKEKNNKKLKALEIIKKYIKVYKIHNGYMLTDENRGETMISKEEYDLLKEVLL